jgi:hypothetical protein
MLCDQFANATLNKTISTKKQKQVQLHCNFTKFHRNANEMCNVRNTYFYKQFLMLSTI